MADRPDANAAEELSASPQVERFYGGAPRQLLNPRDDFFAVMEEFVADDGMGGEDH